MFWVNGLYYVHLSIMSLGELSNFQINNILRNDKSFGGCYSKDQLPANGPRQKSYIINLENHNQGGSHWVLVSDIQRETTVYFDSYGVPPPNAVKSFIEKSGKSWTENSREIQPLGSDLCGWYCIYVANKLKNNTLENIIRQFSNNDNLNDRCLRQYFNVRT